MFHKLKEVHSMKKRLAEVEQYLEEALSFPHPEVREHTLATLHAGGKRVRPTLTIMTASMFHNEKNIIPLAAAMELIHMSSLIHDDVVDQAATRRNEPTIQTLHNNQFAVLIGEFVFAKALEIVSKQPQRERLLQIVGQMGTEMCLGEVDQLRTTFDIHQTVEDYNYRINRKTAMLMATSCQAAAVASNASEEAINIFYKIGYNLGMDFQIRDDILDMSQDAKKLGKPAGSDLARGIMTLPTILVLQKDFAEKEELIQLIESRFQGGQPEVERAMSIIIAQGGLEEATAYAEGYLKQAEVYIEQLPIHSTKKLLLDGVDYLRGRAF